MSDLHVWIHLEPRRPRVHFFKVVDVRENDAGRRVDRGGAGVAEVSLSQGNQHSQPRLAQEQAEPNDHSQHNRADGLRFADAKMSSASAAEIAGKQDRAQDGGGGEKIKDRAGKLDDPQCNGIFGRPAEVIEIFTHLRRHVEFHDRTKDKHQRRQNAQHPANPEGGPAGAIGIT